MNSNYSSTNCIDSQIRSFAQTLLAPNLQNKLKGAMSRAPSPKQLKTPAGKHHIGMTDVSR